MKFLKFFIALVFLCSTFSYGLIVGLYKVYPFEHIKELKYLFTGKDTENNFGDPKYIHKVSFFKALSRANYDIVFVGDSLTDRSDWYDIYPNQTIANRGIDGDTTAGVLKRIESITNTNASKAFIMLGVNDINSNIPVSIIFNNYIKIIEKLKASNINSYVQSTLLTDHIAINNSDIVDLNSRLRDYCRINKITFIDLNPLLSSDGKLNNKFSTDGIHLNGSGYIIWSNEIRSYI